MKDFVYLDYAAATPVDPLVLQDMLPYFSEFFYNPSSPYAPAVEVKRGYSDAKSRIARCLGVQADELVMTAGATESVNIALNITDGQLAVSAIEHASVLEVARQRSGSIIQVNKKGRISPEDVARAINADTELVSVGLVNSELGIIQPIEDIARVIEGELKNRRNSNNPTPLYFHCDATQGAALLDIKPKRLGVDLLTLGAAKVHGPKQVGLLWARPGLKIRPTVMGGGQEMGIRSGTENVAGVMGFATAIELASKRRTGEVKRLRAIRDRMQSIFESEIPSCVISSDSKKGLANFLHISFAGIDAERLIFWLENKGILVATGSACAANKNTKSHVLEAIGMEDQLIQGSLRISPGRLSNAEDCEKAAYLIVESVKAERARLGLL